MPLTDTVPLEQTADIPFNALPFVQRVRTLREMTGGSLNCGWMCDEQAFLLYSLAKFYKPEVILQTGHLWGKSALVLTEAIHDGFLMGESSIEPDIQNNHEKFSAFIKKNSPKRPLSYEFISIDPLPRNVPHYREGVEYIRELHPNFTFHQLMSDEYFARVKRGELPSPKGKRIMGIVDGDHSYMGCLSDLKNMHALGVDLIIVDDTSWIPFLRRACATFARRNGYTFTNLPYYNGVGILRRKRALSPELEHAVSSGDSIVSELGYLVGGYHVSLAATSLWKKSTNMGRRARRLAMGAMKRVFRSA